ncbi:hypothetical protein CBM2623_B30218 [Cupriavidus taiwanensis]|nr:hypothetical protein CBM2608_B30222 [Cupriavidus taiwanensis]SPA34662.1 hypothetical protein CBM2623_B30218 [Cupriavidus taiwanensis]
MAPLLTGPAAWRGSGRVTRYVTRNACRPGASGACAPVRVCRPAANPPGLDARFARTLCRSASPATIERDVRALLDLPLAAPARPEPDAVPDAMPDGLRRPFHAVA